MLPDGLHRLPLAARLALVAVDDELAQPLIDCDGTHSPEAGCWCDDWDDLVTAWRGNWEQVLEVVRDLHREVEQLRQEANKLRQQLATSEASASRSRRHAEKLDYKLMWQRIDARNPEADKMRERLAEYDASVPELWRQLAVANGEAAELRAKLAKLTARSKEKGEKPGRKPYGTRPGEMAIVELIRQMTADYRYDDCRADIANRLNKLGHKTRTGAKWRSQQVGDILRRYPPGK